MDISRSRALLLFSSFSCGLITALGQSPARDAPVQLHDVQHFGTEGLVCNGISPVVMESNSFLAQLVGGPEFENVVVRIALDGSSHTRFDIKTTLRPAELSDRIPYVWAFASGSSEKVYVLTRWLKNRVSDINNILVFDSHGVLQRIIPLPIADIQVLHMAGFRDGGFVLLAGRNGELGFRSIEMIVVADDGKILVEKPLRELSSAEEGLAKTQALQEAEAYKARIRATQDAAKKTSATTSNEKENSVSQTDANTTSDEKHPGAEMNLLFFQTLLMSSEDGTVYMTRPDKPGLVYRVSSDGNMTAISLKSEEKNTVTSTGYTELANGTVSRGQLILFYAKMDSAPSYYKSRHLLGLLIKSYNLSDGELTGVYVGNSQLIGSTPAGWNGNGPYYLKYLKNAQPPGFEIIASAP